MKKPGGENKKNYPTTTKEEIEREFRLFILRSLKGKVEREKADKRFSAWIEGEIEKAKIKTRLIKQRVNNIYKSRMEKLRSLSQQILSQHQGTIERMYKLQWEKAQYLSMMQGDEELYEQMNKQADWLESEREDDPTLLNEIRTIREEVDSSRTKIWQLAKSFFS